VNKKELVNKRKKTNINKLQSLLKNSNFKPYINVRLNKYLWLGISNISKPLVTDIDYRKAFYQWFENYKLEKDKDDYEKYLLEIAEEIIEEEINLLKRLA
jgi:hypothetical protein